MTRAKSLKRSLGLPAVTFYGVGAILGAGIYVLIGKVAGASGYFAPVSFVLAALIALFSAFSFAELGARFPRSAGVAVYIAEAFKFRGLTQLIGLLVVFTGVVSAATMATGIVGYVQLFSDLPDLFIIVLFVAVIAGVAIWGIEEASWVITIITLLEVGGLIYVVAIASDSIVKNPISNYISLDLLESPGVASGIFLGGFVAFYAFIGFEDMVNLAEEVKQPEQALPKAIILALLIATALYIAVSIAALAVLSPEQLSVSKAPLADVVSSQGESASWIALVSLIAVINGAIVQMIMASRIIYGMAAEGLLIKGLATINTVTLTPIRATLLCALVTVLLALIFPLTSLAQATSLVILAVFAMVNIALIKVNRTFPASATVHYSNWVPYMGALLCLAMILSRIII